MCPERLPVGFACPGYTAAHQQPQGLGCAQQQFLLGDVARSSYMRSRLSRPRSIRCGRVFDLILLGSAGVSLTAFLGLFVGWPVWLLLCFCLPFQFLFCLGSTRPRPQRPTFSRIRAARRPARGQPRAAPPHQAVRDASRSLTGRATVNVQMPLTNATPSPAARSGASAASRRLRSGPDPTRSGASRDSARPTNSRCSSAGGARINRRSPASAEMGCAASGDDVGRGRHRASAPAPRCQAQNAGPSRIPQVGGSHAHRCAGRHAQSHGRTDPRAGEPAQRRTDQIGGPLRRPGIACQRRWTRVAQVVQSARMDCRA